MEPARGATLSFKSVDDPTVSAGSALVGKDGTYSVSLPPGVYTVRWVDIGSLVTKGSLGIGPRMVQVSPGEHGRVDFTIDTGIR